MSTTPVIRAYLGGSFNPVHNGHIQMALHVYDCLAPIATKQQCPLHISLLPNARSPFKEHSTAPAYRLAMLELAIKGTPLQISELELWQTPPVYTIDSVRALRQCHPNDTLIFIMGMDSARSLEKWKDGLQLTNYVHLWIFSRSDSSDSLQPKQIINNSDNTDESDNTQNLSIQNIAALCRELPSQLQTQVTDKLINLALIDLAQPVTYPLNAACKDSKPLKDYQYLKASHPLKNRPQGRIYIDPRQVTAVSSTNIRQQLQTGNHIANNRANSPTKLLNPTVYQYIIAHQLYSAV
ncbi:nicotinate-nicotinamide nucleotide adenylyltransferase [Psychrobacter frigidicola]|uniref:nicotinate-nicotinamide nucleotide adenylyltransferase n=1 Tax=Psychrobacter frigidicola TaxID=45611 RepID=UPI00191AE3D3|nr:nicotinate-nicotinamide nucleotide adenylyltransferase [Psychrobacter frigidicola]